MGIVSRQEKAMIIRDLIAKVNALVLDLEGDGCVIKFSQNPHGRHHTITGIIKDVEVQRLVTL